jgi:DNA-binding SARP family transcriptional activator/tetratricopeptide (TPR) repeat protein
VRWRILGPVEAVTRDGTAAPIHRPQQRAVLAYLLLNAGQVVPAARLIEALWAEAPPAAARPQMQVCVSQIRAALRESGNDGAVRTDAGGYRLECAAEDLDLGVFGTRVARAAAVAATDPALGADLIREGLAEWRGVPLTGAVGAFVTEAAAELTERRLAAYELLADLELELGRHDALVPTLRAVVREHPYRERSVARLMLALAGRGQQADALRVFADARDRLVGELGVDPGPELAATHVRVLRGDLAPAVSRPDPTPPRPAQLPADVTAFTGRTDHLRHLDGLIPDARTVVISAIDGTAGVGKTSLAVHWAHRMAPAFPDGQLFVNLRGFDPAGTPTGTAEAVRGFLDAFGTPPDRIPAGVDAQVSLYRSLLAGKRVLVVLDNARDADQVRPLLPGAAGCLALVTSRHRLTGLLAREGADRVTLDLLTAAESRLLLASRLGADRVAAEPSAVDAIVRACAGLPLALAIAAARASDPPDRSLAAVAGQLDAARGGLDPFDVEDPLTDVRTVLSWSYRALSVPAARLFRLLAAHPGPDVTVDAAANLVGVPAADIRSRLAELTNAAVLSETVPGRYAFHDLLRAYAGEMLENTERRDAVRRLLDYYVGTAIAAARRLEPNRDRPAPPPPAAGVTAADPPTDTAALAWFGAEHRPLVAAVRLSAEAGLLVHCGQLASAVADFLERGGHRHDLLDIRAIALAAAVELGDPLARAYAHRGLARAYAWFGRHDETQTELEAALALFVARDDRIGRADTHLFLGGLLALRGRHGDAAREAERALELFTAGGEIEGQARALNNLGWYQAKRGDYGEALALCGRALVLDRRVGNRRAEADCWHSLGFVHNHLGDPAAAEDAYRQALDGYRGLGFRYAEASTLVDLGDLHATTGDPGVARDLWRHALRILDDLDHPDAAGVHTRLASGSA